MDWHESVRVVNSQASIPGPRIPASVAVLQLPQQAFLSHEVIYTANQHGPVSDCSARQVMFVVINNRACRRRTLHVSCFLKLIIAFELTF